MLLWALFYLIHLSSSSISFSVFEQFQDLRFRPRQDFQCLVGFRPQASLLMIGLIKILTALVSCTCFLSGHSYGFYYNTHIHNLNLFHHFSGNHSLDSSSLLRHNYQAPSVGSTISNGDIEFIDPAILAVGKGLLPGGMNSSGLDDLRMRYSSQLSTYEEAKFQSILQRSLPSHQNQRFATVGESFSPLVDAYGISSRVMEQTLGSNISPLSQFTLPQSRNGIISNGQWDSWNELQAGNNLGMAEILRNERLGYNNKFYGGYEDAKIRMPSSGNLYNGTYGI